MLKWLPYPFIRLLIPYCLGVLAGKAAGSNWIGPLYLQIAMLLLFLMIMLNLLVDRGKGFRAGFLVLTFLFVTGIYQFNESDERKNRSHLVNQDSVEIYRAKVITAPLSKGKNYRFVSELNSVFTGKTWRKATGKVMIYLPQDIWNQVDYGSEILIKGKPEVVKPPQNPSEFDFQAYLAGDQIYHRHFLKDPPIHLNTGKTSILNLAVTLRDRFKEELEKNLHTEREASVAKALILGWKDDLDQETRESFGSAGAMHVLAVSGLHVGIIYAVLVIIFGYLRKSSWGRILFPVILLCFLWGYALVTGFAPSVQRAVTMFSLVIIAESMQRKSNIYNSIALSAFILLFLQPGLLFSLGFQLSYLAVISIIYFHPKIYSWFLFDYNLSDKIWSLCSVSIAASIGTLPLTLYYFHQFPTLFLISNLLVVPAAFIIVSGGLLLLVTSSFDPLAAVVGFGLHKMLWLINEFVLRLHQLPFSKIDRIVISPLQVGLLFFTIIFISAFFHLRKFKFLLLGFTTGLAVFLLQIQKIYQWKGQDEMIVYATSGGTAIDFVSGQSSKIFSDNLQKFYDFQIAPNHLQSGIIEFDQVKASTLCWEGLDLLVVDGRKILMIRKKINNWPELPKGLPIDIDYLVISNNVKIPVDKIVQFFKIKLLILDGSNYSSTLKYYRENAELAKVPVHFVSEKGYYSTTL